MATSKFKLLHQDGRVRGSTPFMQNIFQLPEEWFWSGCKLWW